MAANKNNLFQDISSIDLRALSPGQVRQEFRQNSNIYHRTSGLCAGYLQMNIVCLPSSFANDFERLCHENPAPLPLAYRSKPGEVTAPDLVKDFDIRSDLGLYGVFNKEKFVENQEDLLQHPPWDDMVTFYFGCSFSLEGVAEKASVGFRIVAEGLDTPLFFTNIPLASAGVFRGSKMVVTMRPCKKSLIEKLVQAVAPHEIAHGAPIHIGDPSIIGITDTTKPFFGSVVELKSDEAPVFWACGVSAREALLSAGIDDYWVTHNEESCNYLLITDVKVDDYLASHKPSFGDLKPKVVTLFEEPQFMSLLSDKTFEEISKFEGRVESGTPNGESTHREGSLARAALMLSHSYFVAIETRHRDNALILAKTLLGLGKKVILFPKDDEMVPTIREEVDEANDSESLSELQVLGARQVNSPTQSCDPPMNEVCWSRFTIVVSQNRDSWNAVEELACSSSVRGTSLDVSPWGYDVTSKALECLRGCVVHSRYRNRGVGRLGPKM